MVVAALAFLALLGFPETSHSDPVRAPIFMATRAYVAALKAFSEVRNHVEHAKTALKYAKMVLAKGAESEKPDRHEVENAIETLGRALLVLRARNLTAEVDDGERVLHALQRMGVRLR